jgi:hypothetical protein
MARSREKRDTQPVNWAEWLLDLGKQVNRQIRRGAGIEEVSRRFQTTVDACKLSVVFFRSSDLLKVRAIVEDWSRDRLITELGGIYRTPPVKQQAGSR